ncbi:MAG: DsrE family protein [Desulfocucumaceae bacterium]
MGEKIVDTEKLVVLWTSGDKEVAVKMVFMYTLNSKLREWWKDVSLIVWGPSSRLLSDDAELQEYMARIIKAGVEVMACKACTDMYGVSGKLEEMGIEVKYMGLPFTQILKEGSRVITV